MKLGLGIRRAKILYSVSQFLFYFNAFWLIQNVYFTEHGLNYSQLAIILSAWSVSVILFEIPSGILADRFSRKSVIIFGKLAFLLGMISIVIWPNFWGFLLGVTLFGMHESFISGAEEALFYDYLKQHHHEDMFKEVLSTVTVFRELGLGLSVLIAGFIAKFGMQYNLTFALISAFLGLLFSFALPHVQAAGSEFENPYTLFRSSFKKVMRIRHLRVIMFFTVCVLISYMVISEYFVLSLKEVGLNYETIGILAVVEMLFFGLGSYASRFFEDNLKEKFYYWLAIFMGLGMLFVNSGTIWGVLIGFLAMRSLKAVAEVYSGADWQSHAESLDRATLGSMRSLVSNFAYIPMAFGFGFVADKMGFFSGFYVTAVVAFSFLCLMLPKLKLKK